MTELDDIHQLFSALRWMSRPDLILGSLKAMVRDLRDRWGLWAPTAALIVALLGLRSRLRARLNTLGQHVTKLSKAQFSDTLRALAVTVALALPWPILLWFTSMRLATQQTPNAVYALALAHALMVSAGLSFALLFTRHMIRDNGLAGSHFRWLDSSRKLLRRELNWYLPAVIPLAFVIAMIQTQPIQAHHDSLGRLAFAALMAVSALALYRIAHPTSGLANQLIRKHPGGWLDRLRRMWFPLLLATPFALALAAIWGYQYTALQLAAVITKAVLVVLIVALCRALLVRWLNIAQRKLALEQWRKKATSKTSAAEGSPIPENEGEVEEAELNVSAISTQTMKLLNSTCFVALVLGLGIIISEIMPAFTLFNNIELWSTQVSNGEGGPQTLRREVVTLADLMLAILVLVLSILIARNIPGLLEIAVLQRLPITPGGRYAITAVVRYVLVIIGLSVTFGAIGIGWSKVQWLAAAVTVGLGFGLQEIFANFVSGLIMLFERQIRVGDIVTVGSISGKVASIKMRATTVTDWDRKELIIPNKEFVTGQVINWSLSDTILRLVIPVGIAYGSDTHKAHQILLDAARNNENVLDNPEPVVWFTTFGASSLDFELRMFIPHIDLMWPTRHALMMDIDQRFRAADIEIAFPQRDIHIRDINGVLATATAPEDKILNANKATAQAVENGGPATTQGNAD